MTVTITVSAQFTDSNGTPATGLTLTEVDITLVSIRKSDGNETVIWNALDSTRELTSLGMYQKDYASADLDTYWYFAMAEYVGATVLDADFVYGQVGESGLDVDGRVDVGDWLGQAVTLSAGNLPNVNANEISEDAVAADNLEAQYDTTGLSGDTFPATQAQVGNIASGTAATNTVAASVTVTVGSEINSYTDTEELDGTVHEVNPVGGNTDFYYEFNVGANGVPVAVQWEGYANGQNDTYAIYAWKWSGSVYQQVGEIEGAPFSTVVKQSFDLTTGHVGTGANDGLVRWRSLSADGTGFNTDRILCSFATNFTSVGYADGAIWVDSNAVNTNTVRDIDGVADNPVSTWAAALTLNNELKLHNFRIANGSTIALTGNSDNYTIKGSEWVLALGGQSIASAHIEGATVSGVGIGNDARFIDCHMGTVTLSRCEMDKCAIADTITLSAADTYLLDGCWSAIAGSATPTIDFGALIANTALNIRHYSGGIELENMGVTGTDTMSLEGHGQLVINANCSAGDISIRGLFTVTDNAGGALTLSDDARYDVDQVGDAVWDEVISTSEHNAAQSAGQRLRQATATVVANDTAETSNSPGVNQIQLASGESSTDGTFDPGLVGIIAGAGQGQSRLILEYAGASRIATLNRDWKTAPDGTSEYIIMATEGGLHVNEGLATGGTASTITLNALASTTDNVYNDQIVFLVSGTGQDQVGRITAYNGGTKIATMAQTWGTVPNTTTGYIMVPDAPALFQGYESAAIWIDTINGQSGVVSYENGTAENPVDSLADATTLATDLGFSHFVLLPGSNVTLGQSYDNFVFSGLGGNGWILALGGQSISGTSIMGATVSGICTGVNAPSFIHCSIGSATIPVSRFIACAITSSIICSGTGAYIFDQCYSGVAGTGSPDIDFGALVGSTQLNFRHYSGGIEIKNMGATITDTMSLEGKGQLIINASCVAGTVAIRGHFTVTDNASGALTLSDNARVDIDQIEVGTDQALSGRLPTALVSGRMDSDVAVIQNGVVTAAAIGTDAIDADALAADAVAEIQSGLGTSANQTTILARIGAFTGSGINTILGFFLAGFKADAGTPSDIGGTFNPSTDSLESIRDTAPLGTVMRGTDSAALASVATEARLAELDPANLPADVDTVLTRLPAALVSGRMNSDIRAINGNTDSAAKLALSANTMEVGTAIAGTLSTTEMTTDLTEVTDDHYNGRIVIWTSGNLLRQVAAITGYVGSTKKLTFTAVTEAPTINDTWIMV